MRESQTDLSVSQGCTLSPTSGSFQQVSVNEEDGHGHSAVSRGRSALSFELQKKKLPEEDEKKPLPEEQVQLEKDKKWVEEYSSYLSHSSASNGMDDVAAERLLKQRDSPKEPAALNSPASPVAPGTAVTRSCD